MGQAIKPDQKRRLGFLTGLRMCEAIEREFPELSRWKVIRLLAIVLDDMQRSITEKRYVMKRFEELEARQQILLMVRLGKKIRRQRLSRSCHGSVAEWARTKGSTHLIFGAARASTSALTNVRRGPDTPRDRETCPNRTVITASYPIGSQNHWSRSRNRGRIEG
jgi:hypothetical protein